MVFQFFIFSCSLYDGMQFLWVHISFLVFNGICLGLAVFAEPFASTPTILILEWNVFLFLLPKQFVSSFEVELQSVISNSTLFSSWNASSTFNHSFIVALGRERTNNIIKVLKFQLLVSFVLSPGPWSLSARWVLLYRGAKYKHSRHYNCTFRKRFIVRREENCFRFQKHLLLTTSIVCREFCLRFFSFCSGLNVGDYSDRRLHSTIATVVTGLSSSIERWHRIIFATKRHRARERRRKTKPIRLELFAKCLCRKSEHV